MSSAAIVERYTGAAIVVHGPADLLGPRQLGRQLAQHAGPSLDAAARALPPGVTTTGARAPRSVVDACTHRYELEASTTGTVHHYRPAAEAGRWVHAGPIHTMHAEHLTHQEHTR